jgi:hypothetical protein
MAYESKSGLNVNNFYGPRSTGGAVGEEERDNSRVRLSIDLTGTILNGTYLPPVVIPKGALVLTTPVLRVDEAFTLGGTSPTVQIGLTGSVATNNVTITQTELQAIGTKPLSTAPAGTLATTSTTGVAAAAKLAFALGGTSPTVTAGVGKATLIVEYFLKTKV